MDTAQSENQEMMHVIHTTLTISNVLRYCMQVQAAKHYHHTKLN